MLLKFLSLTCYLPANIHTYQHIEPLSHYYVILRSGRWILKPQESCTLPGLQTGRMYPACACDMRQCFLRGCFDLGNTSHTLLCGTICHLLPKRCGKAGEKWKGKFTHCSFRSWKQSVTLTTLSLLIWGRKFSVFTEKEYFILFILFSLVKINYVTKLFTFEPFLSFHILALLCSLFPVSFIRKQGFA